MKNYLIVGLAILLFSCGGTSEPTVQVFPSDTVLIENNYPPITDLTVLSVMEKLQVCSRQDTNKILPNCSAENFRIFPLGNEFTYEEGFILEMKAGVFNSPVKQVMIIQKVFNAYKIINRYFGFLVEYRTSKSGYNDLLIGYKDPQIGIVAIKHEWDRENYQPIDVEEINGYYIKPEAKDSINKVFIDGFSAGY